MKRQREENDASKSELEFKRSLLALEKKINKNTDLRIRHASEPSKFLESEAELNEQLKSLFSLSTTPYLYPSFISMGGLKSCLELLIHENSDISITVLDLLVELIDSDVAIGFEDQEAVLANVNSLLSAIVDSKESIGLLISTLLKFNSSSIDEDIEGIQSFFTLMENLLDISPSSVVPFCRFQDHQSSLLHVLVHRILKTESSPLRTSASELLSSILHDLPELVETFASNTYELPSVNPSANASSIVSSGKCIEALLVTLN